MFYNTIPNLALWYVFELCVISIFMYIFKSKIIIRGKVKFVDESPNFIYLDEICFMRDVGIEILNISATKKINR